MDNLSQFLAEMPPLESLSKQELVERVQEAERKWLDEQRINMELVYEMETDVQEQKITTLRQRVHELEKERDHWQEAFSLYVADYERVCAERDELRDDKKAGFDRVFEEMHDDPEDPYDRKWSTICLHISSQREEIAELSKQHDELLAALEAGRRLIELISPFEGDVTRQIDKAIASVKEK